MTQRFRIIKKGEYIYVQNRVRLLFWSYWQYVFTSNWDGAKPVVFKNIKDAEDFVLSKKKPEKFKTEVIKEYNFK